MGRVDGDCLASGLDPQESGNLPVRRAGPPITDMPCQVVPDNNQTKVPQAQEQQCRPKEHHQPHQFEMLLILVIVPHDRIQKTANTPEAKQVAAHREHGSTWVGLELCRNARHDGCVEVRRHHVGTVEAITSPMRPHACVERPASGPQRKKGRKTRFIRHSRDPAELPPAPDEPFNSPGKTAPRWASKSRLTLHGAILKAVRREAKPSPPSRPRPGSRQSGQPFQ